MAGGAAVRAQQAEKTAAFEVAVIRPGNPNSSGSNLNIDPAHFRSQNMPVLFLLQFAYDLNHGSKDQIIGAPSWVSTAGFDITTKPTAAMAEDLKNLPDERRMDLSRQMLRQLLADRFHLVVHHESRKLPVLALTVAKGGPKVAAVQSHRTLDKNSPDSWAGLHNPERGHTVGHEATMKMLLDVLSSNSEIGGRLIVDKTGLNGEYDFDLRWMPETNAGPVAQNADGPSLFAALQEQLGLKLKAEKEPVDCIVIDHIEQPTPN
jgi:uncharacterized protein (TIGR03435 family)